MVGSDMTEKVKRYECFFIPAYAYEVPRYGSDKPDGLGYVKRITIRLE